MIVPATRSSPPGWPSTHAGATPVPVDPDPQTYNLDPDHGWQAAVTPRTRAVIPVHLYGQPADMEPIVRCRRTGTA